MTTPEEPGGACFAIACVGGATFDADFPWTFQVAQRAQFEVCRGDFCLQGTLNAGASAPPNGAGNGTGFTLTAPGVADPADAEGFANVSFMSDGQGALYLEVTWTPRSVTDLDDGDHYRVSMILDGKPIALIDDVVHYQSNDIGRPGCPCYQRCLRAKVDQRGSGLPNDDDAGAE